MRYSATTEGKNPNRIQRRRENAVAVSMPARLPYTVQKARSMTVTTSTPAAEDKTNCPPIRSAVMSAQAASSPAETKLPPLATPPFISVGRQREIVNGAVEHAQGGDTQHRIINARTLVFDRAAPIFGIGVAFLYIGGIQRDVVVPFRF